MLKEGLCECGRNHQNIIRKISVKNSDNLIDELKNDLSAFNSDEIVFVSDQIVSKKYESLFKAFKNIETFIFKREKPLIPDELAVGELLLAVSQSIKLIVCVGSGTLNDLCRYISFRLKIPYWVVMSAPSMDGYASTASPIITNGFKETYYCHCAECLYGDRDVINNAPKMMLLAGLGDLFGKITALTDWKISNILNDEYYCPQISKELFSVMSMIEENIIFGEDTVEFQNDNSQGIGEIVNDALIESGIYMYYVGNSRPASGAEHLVSHSLEMKALREGREVDLHGLKVGIATSYVLSLYKYLFENINIVQDLYDLEPEKLEKIKETIEYALSFKGLVDQYQIDVSEISSHYSKEEIIEAMKEGPKIRERFTVLHIFEKIGWDVVENAIK